MKKSVFRVVREHEGDRFYKEGDTRIAVASEVNHLVPRVLELIGEAPDEPEEKAEETVDNKSEGDAPANKAATGHKAKGK